MMFSSMTSPHFLQTASPMLVEMLNEPHSGHFIFIKKLNTLNLLNFLLFRNILLKNYTLIYELRKIYI